MIILWTFAVIGFICVTTSITLIIAVARTQRLPVHRLSADEQAMRDDVERLRKGAGR